MKYSTASKATSFRGKELERNGSVRCISVQLRPGQPEPWDGTGVYHGIEDVAAAPRSNPRRALSYRDNHSIRVTKCPLPNLSQNIWICRISRLYKYFVRRQLITEIFNLITSRRLFVSGPMNVGNITAGISFYSSPYPKFVCRPTP